MSDLRSLQVLVPIIWTSPNTLLGISVGLTGLCFGGKYQRVGRCLEFHGGLVKWLLERGPLGNGIMAMTLGHSILGQTESALDSHGITSMFTFVNTRGGDHFFCQPTLVARLSCGYNDAMRIATTLLKSRRTRWLISTSRLKSEDITLPDASSFSFDSARELRKKSWPNDQLSSKHQRESSQLVFSFIFRRVDGEIGPNTEVRIFHVSP